MKREYGFNIHVSHVVYVEADTIDEAEELALDQFMDEKDSWEMHDLELVSRVDLPQETNDSTLEGI